MPVLGTTTRFLIAAVLVAAIQGGAYLIRRGGTARQVSRPQQDLREIPTQLGPWTGKEVQLDPRTYQATGSEVLVNRQYRNPAGDTASLHAAMWLEFSIKLPHRPEICYPASGYEIISENDWQLQVADQSSMPVRLLTVRRDAKQSYVVYWYQLGERIIIGRAPLQRAPWTFRGMKTYPPLIKVMLHVPVSDPDRAQDQLQSIAGPLSAWLREFH